MVTVAHIAGKIVERRPFLEEALARGIINYAFLAESLRPEIEKELKKEVNPQAIAMALRRLSERLARRSKRARAFVSFRETDVTVKSDLFEMTILKSQKSIDNIRRAYGLVNFSQGGFLIVTHGLYEITIIASKKYKARIQKIFSGEKALKTIDNLSSLTVKMPIEAVEAVGPIYTVAKALNWENIAIIEIVSTLTEMTLILKEEDVSRAFGIVKEIIREQQEKK